MHESQFILTSLRFLGLTYLWHIVCLQVSLQVLSAIYVIELTLSHTSFLIADRAELKFARTVGKISFEAVTSRSLQSSPIS